MAFVWKEPKKIWKGEGIYHLTFVVAGRRPLLGELVPLGDSCGEDSNRSYVEDVERVTGIEKCSKTGNHGATKIVTAVQQNR